MSTTGFGFTRLAERKKVRVEDLRAAMGMEGEREAWLFVSPHDDDVPLGGGLLMQAAARAGVDVHVLVVTDGSMGYCTLEQRDSISEIRKKETYESYEILGVSPERVQYVGYPDGALYTWCGRRKAMPGEPAIEGYVGLSNAFTYHLRRIKPQRVFVPTIADLHPDHQITNNELMICLFHAAGTIWPELGAPLTDVPKVYELAVYCDFPQPPQLEIRAGGEAFEKKLESIGAYRSQTQIAKLVEIIRKAGAFEYLRELNFRFYSPSNYRGMFE
ncbi:MAG TPA: PIG-L family deacetylase [Tepidisphaeraceae bacterium]|jgi:LmbE family N-acetylglucosaminyl deacetylase